MFPQLNPASRSDRVLSASQNKVLRNTYLLLAATMVPTVLGAWVGISSGFSLFAGSPFICSSKRVGLLLLLLGFTFFMGLMLSRLLGYALGLGNGAQLIGLAAGGTGVVFFSMASLSTVIKKDLSSMGKFLFIGVILLIVASVANIWLQMPALMLTISLLAVVIFSLFLLYDLQRIVNGGETNYVSATLSVYLNVYNIFSNLLVLLMALFGGGSRE